MESKAPVPGGITFGRNSATIVAAAAERALARACRTCRFWHAPKEMTPEQEATARAAGVKRTGQCHRFPKSEDTAAEYRCGEFVAGKSR